MLSLIVSGIGPRLRGDDVLGGGVKGVGADGVLTELGQLYLSLQYKAT
jgi:hypothetical protein